MLDVFVVLMDFCRGVVCDNAETMQLRVGVLGPMGDAGVVDILTSSVNLTVFRGQRVGQGLINVPREVLRQGKTGVEQKHGPSSRQRSLRCD